MLQFDIQFCFNFRFLPCVWLVRSRVQHPPWLEETLQDIFMHAWVASFHLPIGGSTDPSLSEQKTEEDDKASRTCLSTLQSRKVP